MSEIREKIARAMMRTTAIPEYNDVETVSLDWCGDDLWSCDFGAMADAAISVMGWQPIDDNEMIPWKAIILGRDDVETDIGTKVAYSGMGWFDPIDGNYKFHGSWGEMVFDAPTHWQPLPAPPKVGE